jgi:hypothetical protein
VHIPAAANTIGNYAEYIFADMHGSHLESTVFMGVADYHSQCSAFSKTMLIMEILVLFAASCLPWGKQGVSMHLDALHYLCLPTRRQT